MFTITLLILSSIALVESAKILVVVPTPSISHQIVFRPLVQELISLGHDVTVITTDPVYPKDRAPKNLREIDIHNVTYNVWAKWFKKTKNIDQDDLIAKMIIGYNLLSEVFEQQLKDRSVQKFIRNKTEKFDLLIIEAFVTSSLVFSHIFKAPVILMSSFGARPGTMETLGAATHPFLYPIHYRRRIYNLTMFEKIKELYNHGITYRVLEKQERENDKMLKSVFGNNMPTLSELKNNVDMLFLNVHPIWLHNQPVPPNVIYTWGIHKTPEQALPKDLQSYLDSSKNGAIYVSFGTNYHTSSMPPETLEMLLKVLSKSPYSVLWKWDADEMPGRSDNIKISKWFPQGDVLRHPNVKLFITQAGLQSTDEAINYGVPLIGMPMIADQEYNSEKYEHFKIGIKLGFKSLTAERFEHAIDTIFKNHESYQKNIIQLRTQMQDVPKPPLENAIWWIEYVLRHGGARHLRAPAANMSWAEYYELKLVLVLFSGLTITIAIILLLMYFSFKHITRIINLQNKKSKVS